MKIYLIIFCLLCFPATIFAQSKIDTAAIKKRLEIIDDRDQAARRNSVPWKQMKINDSLNLIEVETLIQTYGWPGIDFVGEEGNITVWLVIQHAEIAVQEKYLPLLKKSVADSQSRPCDLALLEDRVLMRQGKKQIYGSQIIANKTTGAWEFYPIEDEKNVNSRRASVGLGTIEEYAKNFGIVYKPAK